MDESLLSWPEGAAVLEVLEPEEQRIPFVFASPHSGALYPPAFKAASKLDDGLLRRSEDCFVDEIFAIATEHGAPLLRAHFPRAYVDPNREPYELDPTMFSEPLPDFVNTESPRVRAGLGTIARVVTSGAEIYRRKLSFAEAETLVETLYRPYHAKLQALIEGTVARFGHCVLIDCHSMPSTGGPMDRDHGANRLDFVLGDCFGASCSQALTARAEALLTERGYCVARNHPYAGGFTTHHYGRPNNNVHALQIEINRRLYMDEERYTRLPGLEELKGLAGELVAALAEVSLSAPPRAIIRDSQDEDLPAILAIYAHYVSNTTVNFEDVPPTAQEMAERRRLVLERDLPYLVAEVEGRVIGYAHAHPFRPRSAYRYTVESSIYLAPDMVRRGHGQALLSELIERCTARGYKQLVALIGDSENAGSIGLHRSLGFETKGVLKEVGYKFGRWLDIVMVQRSLK